MAYMSDYMQAYQNGWADGVRDYKEKQKAAAPSPSASSVPVATIDTGNVEADRIINRLMSSDPDFEDCTNAAAFIRRLVAEHKGPDGFDTWKDAAIHERQLRVLTTRDAAPPANPQSHQRISASNLPDEFQIKDVAEYRRKMDAEFSANPAPSTPAATWREKGEPDPHGKQYECERAALTLGKLTDDELANGVFMNADQPLDIDRVLARDPDYHPPIVWLTAAKERIRWLSRALLQANGATK